MTGYGLFSPLNFFATASRAHSKLATANILATKGNSVSIRAYKNDNLSSLERSSFTVYAFGKTTLIELAVYKTF